MMRPTSQLRKIYYSTHKAMKRKSKYIPPRNEPFYTPQVESEHDEVETLRREAIAAFLQAGGELRDLHTVTDKFNNDTQTHTT